MIACQYGHVETAKVLLEHGAPDVDYQDPEVGSLIAPSTE